MDHIGQGFAIFNRFGNVYHGGDVRPAMTYEDPDPRRLGGDVPFLGVYPFFGEISPPVVEEFADLGACAARAEDRLRNIDGALEGAAYKDAGPVGRHGVDFIHLAKTMTAKLNAVFFCDLRRILRRIQSDG